MKPVFRENAVKNIRSADKLDSDIRLVSVRMWIVLILSVTLVGGLLAWGIFGEVPITTEVMGVYTYSFGRINIRSDKDGVIKRMAETESMFNEGNTICEYEDGSVIKTPVNIKLTHTYVTPGERVKEGDLIFSGARIADESKNMERVYLYVPYEKKNEFLNMLPVNLDMMGMSEDVGSMEGFIYESSYEVMTADEAKNKYGKEEIGEIFEDGNPRVEVMCIPLHTGEEYDISGDSGDDKESYRDMGWTASLMEQFFKNVEDYLFNGPILIPDFTLVKARVTLEYRRPITLLIPALSSIFKPTSAMLDSETINWDRALSPVDEKYVIY